MTVLANIALPVFGIMILAFAVPFACALIVREGVLGLVINFALSCLIISAAVFVYFINFYAEQHAPLVADLLHRPKAFTPYYLKWAGKTSLIWLPMLVLGVAAQPKRWKEVVW